jgi:hypothetical protein
MSTINTQSDEIADEKSINIINSILNKKKELGLDITIEVEIISKLIKLDSRRVYVDIVGSLPGSYYKQVQQFTKYIDSLNLPSDFVNLDVRIEPHINDKFKAYQQIIDVQTGDLINFEVSPLKVTLLCFYNVLKNNVDGYCYPYVSESLKYLVSLQRMLDNNENLKKKVKVASFSVNKEHADFINKFINKNKLRNIEHYFISEYKLFDPTEISLGSSPLMIMLDKNKVIRYFGNPIFNNLESNIENLYNGFSVNFNYAENQNLLLTQEEQLDTMEKLKKYFWDVLKGEKKCFSSFTFHLKKIIDKPISSFDSMRCTVVAEVNNLTFTDKFYVEKLLSLIETMNSKIEFDLFNIYAELLEEDRSCCLCQ